MEEENESLLKPLNHPKSVDGETSPRREEDERQEQEFVPTFTRPWHLVVISVYLLTLFIWDLADTTWWQQKNLDWVENMQDDRSDGSENFFLAMTALGKDVFLVPFFLVIILFASPRVSLYLVSINTFTSVTNAWMKLIYRRPRPYWLDTKVESLDGCPTSFGMPSGHAMAGVLLLIYTPVFLFHFYAPAHVKGRALIRNLFYFFCFCVCFLVGFSRVYLGVHSFGQVLIGWGFGLLVAAILQLEPVWNYTWGRITKTPIDNQTVWQYSIGLFVGEIIYLVTYASVSSWDVPQSWINNINETCSEYSDKEEWETFQKHHLMRFGFYLFLFSAFMGYYFAYTKHNLEFNWNRGPWKQIVWTVLLAFIPLVVIGVIVIALGSPDSFAEALIRFGVLCSVIGGYAFWVPPKIATILKARAERNEFQYDSNKFTEINL